MPSDELEISYSPRPARVFVILSALSALFAIAGVIAWATLPDRRPDEQPAAPTPHNLVTDGLGGPLAVETQAPTVTTPGRVSSAVVTGVSRGSEPGTTAPPTPTPAASSMPSFTCDAWSAVIQPGGVVRTGCLLYPAAFPGSVTIECGDDPQGQDCRAEPHAFDLRDSRDPIRFELVVTTLYDTPPSAYAETVRMLGGSGQKHPFTVVVPAVVGTVSISCPPSVSIAVAGDQTVTCEVTSQDGFDGNVMLQGFSAFDGGDVRILVVDPVRVPLGETVSVDLTLRSTGVPPLPVLMHLDVTPEAYVTQPISFVIAPLV